MKGSQPITVKIITPEKTIYNEVVNHVVIPGIEGEIGIFHNHAPFMTYIMPGNLQIHLQNKRIIFIPIKSGMIEFKNDFLTILTLDDISQDEISVSMAEESKEEVEKESPQD